MKSLNLYRNVAYDELHGAPLCLIHITHNKEIGQWPQIQWQVTNLAKGTPSNTAKPWPSRY